MNIIRKLREANGMTQKQLADAIHVTHSLISYWETGKYFPAEWHLEPLAKALGCTKETILYG